MRTLRWVVTIALFVWIGRSVGLVRFWVFGAICIATLVYVARAADPTLFDERRRPAGPTVDRKALAAIRLFAITLFVVAISDIDRFHWSDRVPAAVRVPAMFVFAASMLLAARAVVANRFFSVAVRLQPDRGHQVVTAGPYSVIRHPGYLGMTVAAPAMALALGSWWAVVPALAYSFMIVRRAGVEDRYLRDHLDGYDDYAARVRFRLIPGMW